MLDAINTAIVKVRVLLQDLFPQKLTSHESMFIFCIDIPMINQTDSRIPSFAEFNQFEALSHNKNDKWIPGSGKVGSRGLQSLSTDPIGG